MPHRCTSRVPRNQRLLVLILLAISSVYVIVFSGESTVRRTMTTVDPPKLEHDDKIYKGREKWWNPIVVEKYKLIFFHVPKVSCTEFKLLFMTMKDEPDFDVNATRTTQHLAIHDPELNGLKYLSDYPKKEAEKMMTSFKWTKAVFLREPKERVLSAFLDKAVKSDYFEERCCEPEQVDDVEECKRKTYEEKDFRYFLRRTLDCHDPHWAPQANMIDQKWWSSINFVGYMDNLQEDAEKLLRSLKDSNGVTAWDSYGSTGWGKHGYAKFLARDVATHATSAHDRLLEYYTSCDEEFVEQHWKKEWNIPRVEFKEIKLYDDSVVACEE